MRHLSRILLAAIVCSSCAGTHGGNPKTTTPTPTLSIKVLSANLSPGSKGLVHSASSQDSLTDSLLQLTASNDLSVVTFQVQQTDDITGDITFVTETLPVTAIKNLTDEFVALKITSVGTSILDKTSGNIYGLGTSVNIDELMMNGTQAYYLNVNTGQLSMVDLTDPNLTIVDVNDLNGTTNSGLPTAIFSEFNSPTSPFQFVSFNQMDGLISPWISPSFLFTTNGVLAMSGPSGGQRLEYFRIGQQAYDCNIAQIFSVGGGASGGAFETADHTLYQVQIIPGTIAANKGDALVRLDISASGNCWSPTVINQLNTSSNFPVYSPQTTIEFKSNYLLTDVTRYVLNQSGFLKTFLSGGSVGFTWTALDLSTLPVAQPVLSSSLGGATKRLVVVDGDFVYWLADSSNCNAAAGTDYGNPATTVCRQALTSGGSSPASIPFAPVAFLTSGAAITAFDVLQGVLIYTDAMGTHSVSSAGAAPVFLNSNTRITDTVRF